MSLLSEARPTLQPKLTVNPPGDVYEQEADRIAGRVMRMPEPKLQRTCACGGTCAECQDERRPAEGLQTKRLQAHDAASPDRSAAGGGWEDVRQDESGEAAPPRVGRGFEAALKAEGSGGRPLPPAARRFFEPRFGFSFSHVRIHDGPRAATLSREIGARAFTHGEHVYFAEPQHDVASTESRRLMAHELTHTLQQRGPGPGPSSPSPTPDPRIQRDPWVDVETEGRLESFTDRPGAETRMGQLREQNPDREYRIVEREGNFVIQSRAREAEAEPEEQPWVDVETEGRLESFTDRPGAETRMGQLREQNPDREYRIVEREGNFVIQSRGGTAGAGAGAAAPPPQICGRDSTRVSGFPDPHISRIDIDLGNLSSGLSITWSRQTAETRALASAFPISPGAGLCRVCCDGFNASRGGGSLCTPKGDFTVDWLPDRDPHCQLGNTSWAHNAVYFAANIRSGVAIHKGPSTNMPPRPGYPASHGCVRTSEDGSAIVHDNSVVSDTAVHVGGTWSGTHCYDNSRQSSARRRRGSERCGGSAEAETAPTGTRLAEAQPAEAPVDGAGPA